MQQQGLKHTLRASLIWAKVQEIKKKEKKRKRGENNPFITPTEQVKGSNRIDTCGSDALQRKIEDQLATIVALCQSTVCVLVFYEHTLS